ncbi:MAG TPA: FUSC family protein [Dongiaceae bacterium]|nr:FUSC family protein [Dongiaceae bacterium]
MPTGLRNIIFTLKSFAGAMLAMFISFELDLEKPSWAVLTAYIVAQPFAGMVQSKALYRVVGTLAGGVFAVATLGNISSASTLLAIVLALWLGLCVYLSLLDRTARSYSFMLAGYTASIIAFPSVDTPGAIFDTAVARCEEIIIGIICAVIANQLIFPQRAGVALQGRIATWMKDAAKLIDDVLRRHNEDEVTLADQGRLLADSIAINTLQEHAVFDTPALRDARAWIYELQRRMHSLMAITGSIEDRLSMLRRERSDLLQEHTALLERTAAYVTADPGDTDREQRHALVQDIDAMSVADQRIVEDQHLLLTTTIVARLKDLLLYWDECRDLQRMILEHRRAPIAAVPLSLHRDHLMAALGGISATLAILICNFLWVYSAWPSGDLAVIEAGLLCSIFAAADNPAQLAVGFLKGTIIGTALGGLYVLFLLPPVAGPISLLVVLSLFYLPYGYLLAVPTQVGSALPVILGFTTAVGLQNSYNMPFDSFLNSGIASILGIAAAVIVQRVFRNIGGDWIIERLIAAIRRDLARVAVADRVLDRNTFESRMFDRLNGLLLRRRPDHERTGIMRGSLASLRVGLNLFIFEGTEQALSPLAHKSARLARAELARLFRRRLPDRPQLEQACVLLERAIADIAADGLTSETRQAVLALGAIRLLLLGHVEFFCRKPFVQPPLSATQVPA